MLYEVITSLVEQSIMYTRPLKPRDIFDSFGHYFWDVIGVITSYSIHYTKLYETPAIAQQDKVVRLYL